MVEKVLIPTLEKGIDIVCDRFTDSTLVYQSIMNGLYRGDLQGFNDYVTFGVIPHLTVYFQSDYETFKQRVLSRGVKDNVEIRITEKIFNQMNEEYYKLFLENDRGICVGAELNKSEPNAISTYVKTLVVYMECDANIDLEKITDVCKNGGYCPCATISTPETLCPCKTMMESNKCKYNLFY
jgi:thymidylate kinase